MCAASDTIPYILQCHTHLLSNKLQILSDAAFTVSGMSSLHMLQIELEFNYKQHMIDNLTNKLLLCNAYF